MPACPACGASNRGGARFCYQCSAPLQPIRPAPGVPPSGPSVEDQKWLAHTLGADPQLPAESESSVPVAPRADDVLTAPEQRGTTMSLSDTPTPALFANRYAFVDEQAEPIEVIDHRPWERCWACGATSNEAGELFCIECGASLEGRRYRGQLLREGEPFGLALVPTVSTAQAREVLPEIWDQVTDGEATLTLIQESGHPPVTPPLQELDALRVGRGLAHLLQALHAEGLALGAIAPADLELTVAGNPRLRAVPNLHSMTSDQSAVADLDSLTVLLEELTATPRTTQRLAEEEATQAAELDMVEVLRDLRTRMLADPAALAERLDHLIAERTRPVPLWVRVGAASHAGMVRELDEDSLLTLDLRMVQNSEGHSWGLYIVADGMGGHAAGEVASGLAIRGAAESVMRAYLSPTLETAAPYDEVQLKDIVLKAIQQANKYVLNEAQSRGNDMGTTLTLALVVGDRAVIGNVGDSRTYIYRDGKLRRISQDHSLVMRLVELGQITEEDIYTHPQRNAVLRSLGDKAEVEIDIFTERLKPGDALFLCSDGQWEMTHDPEMEQIITEHGSNPQAACDALIVAANKAGGEDNISSVLVQFDAFTLE